MMADVFWMLAGTGTAACAVALLHASWSRRVRRPRAVLWAAWLLVAASIVPWGFATGREFGPVIAMLVLPLIAWVFVAAGHHVRGNSGRAQVPARFGLPPLAAVRRHAAIFLVSVPLAAVASTLLVLGCTLYLPWRETDRLALAVLLIPFAWGLSSFWATADARLSRPAIGLAAAGSLGWALLFVV